jgi:valyl-tRNA synthetase
MKKELPKAYEPSLYEDGVYKKWEESGFFNPDNLGLPEDAPTYSIVMPPPNVTGTLHMGHAVMLALQDILIRYHRMQGEKTLWLPGTDHAAIATQTRVEKELKKEGLDRHQLGREKFLNRVKKFAQESHDTIVNQVKKIGSSCDWSREAYTLDETRTRAVRSVFKLMYDDGLIYRGNRIVNWCPRCHSTLADDEVEYVEQKTPFYYFKYGPVVIGTARPETKFGDKYIVVHPKDDRYKEIAGKEFEVEWILGKIKARVITDEAAEIDLGSGAMTITPAHSFVDFELAHKYGLAVEKIIDEDGKLTEMAGEFKGKLARDTREEIVKILDKKGLVDHIDQDYVHNLSVCYRCGTPIEPLPSLQWFIDVNKKISKYGKTIKELAIEAVESGVFNKSKIKIVPERFEKNYFHWVRNLRDWCISRQIWFGHQVPVWYCGGADKGQCLPGCEKPIVSIIAPTECPVCGSKDLIQDNDTLDTWFSSGLWTFSTLARDENEIKIEGGKLVIDSDDFKNFHPTAVLETGYDILFFWVARMIIMTTYSIRDIPFEDVYLHGLVRDEKGKKMSKSLGNVIDPLDMIAKYGADATRLSLISGTTPGNDMNLSEEKIAGFRNFTNKLWNISRYILTAVEEKGFQSDEKKIPQTNSLADKWILDELWQTIVEVSGLLVNYQFALAVEALYKFTWEDFADKYLEVAKIEKGKDEILVYVLQNLLKLWHPFMPFVTEQIWQEGDAEGKLLIRENWPIKDEAWVSFSEEGVKENFTQIMNIITAIRNKRAEHKIEPSKKIKAVIYAGNKQQLIESQAHLIKGLLTGIEDLEIRESGERLDKAIYLTTSGVEIYLIAAIDEIKEKTRLKKELENLSGLVASVKLKLANEEFVAKAPPAVIEKERAKLAGWEAELEKLKSQLK